jgi:hypothetical protein
MQYIKEAAVRHVLADDDKLRWLIHCGQDRIYEGTCEYSKPHLLRKNDKDYVASLP